MKLLLKRAKQISIFIFALCIIGCDNDDDRVAENIPGFTQRINEETGTVTFTNTSENSNTYLWTFGDGTTSTEVNPIKTYGPGTYTVILAATNSAGLTETFADTFTIPGEIPPVGNACTAETLQSLGASDLNITFATDPDTAIASFGADLTTVDNPAPDSTNNSCKVGQIDRGAGDLFANNQIDLDAKLDFNANAGFKMKVWSPAAGTNIQLKLEDRADQGLLDFEEVTTSTANAWEELTFPFEKTESGKYDKIILFFELNTNTVATYYIDDLALYVREAEPVNPEENLVTNGGFETGNDSGWESELAGNNGVFAVTDAVSKCDTYSANLAVNSSQLQIIRQANIGVGVVTPNSEITISFDLRGSAGPGGEFVPILFSESTTAGVTKTDLLEGPLTPTDAWTRYTFTTTTGSDVSNGVTLLLQSVCGAVDGCLVDAYIDNVYIAPGGAGGPECDGGPVGSSNIGFSDTSVTVNENAGTATFTVNLNGDVEGGFTVDYATADGSAVQPDDYTATSGTLTFAGNNGESQNIVVPIIDDVLDESQEGFVVNLSNISNTLVLVNSPQVSGGITDNDGEGTTGELAENGGFESGNFDDDSWAVYTNNGSITIDDSDPSSGNFAATLVATPSGPNPTLKQERKGAGTISLGDSVQITFDYKGSLSGEAGLYSFQSFVEATNGANLTTTFSVNPTSTWQTFSQTYTVVEGSQGNDFSGGITMEFVAICGSDPATNCVSTLSVDNVSIIINP